MSISNECIVMIQGMLEKDPYKRLNFKKIEELAIYQNWNKKLDKKQTKDIIKRVITSNDVEVEKGYDSDQTVVFFIL